MEYHQLINWWTLFWRIKYFPKKLNRRKKHPNKPQNFQSKINKNIKTIALK